MSAGVRRIIEPSVVRSRILKQRGHNEHFGSTG
ncbi:hypothetical protein HNQ96_000960 [Aminobacter lissarensis]|uniref:Uncharacterized protein n=1 Tax=Aminobacter carboxidus TaxID=376165 RepID=A0A8E2BAU2_9HYPH|nr:hypothetical protein [Aminobacter lissarensis]